MYFNKIFLILLIPATLGAQNHKLSFDTYLQGQSAIYNFNGNVLVAKKGKIIYEKSFGYADFSTKQKLTSKHSFDCGSIAKEFTATAILMLKDQGKLTYEDSLRKFFPELPYKNITIHQLLTHTSGVPDGYEIIDQYFNHDKIATNSDLINLLAIYKPSVYFKAGEDLMYSGTGFNLLASIIEKVSGKSYNEFLQENIFTVLGMTNTTVANYPRNKMNAPLLSYSYIYVDSLKSYDLANKYYTSWASYFTGITGEGMITTTTGDLLKWDRALKNHNLLTASTQKEMCSLQAEKKTVPNVKFGYGMRIASNKLGECVFHNGWYPGFSSMHLRYTDSDITVIVLSNNQSQSECIAVALAAIALNKKIIMPYVHKEKNIKTKLINFSGKYFMPLTRPPFMVDFPVSILNKNDSLFLHFPGMPDVLLRQESATKFFYGNGTDQQIEFETDNKGKILKANYISYGFKRGIKKIE